MKRETSSVEICDVQLQTEKIVIYLQTPYGIAPPALTNTMTSYLPRIVMHFLAIGVDGVKSMMFI